MNEAKTVLFAISTETISAEQAKKFEDKTMMAIRSGNREYYNSNSVHCDYKDGLIKMCQQYRPSAAIINELLPGMGNIFDIVREIKSEIPEIIIVMLLKDNRVIGDAVLANLAASGIYNWLSAPWKTDTVAGLVVSPKKMKDVESYIPKIVEGSNGLAFETKLVERVEDELDDIVTPNIAGSSNALAMDGKIEDLSQQKENLEVGYHRVIGKGFTGGFGSRFKIGKSDSSSILKADVSETPKVEDIQEFSLDVSKTNKTAEEKKTEEVKIIETPKVEKEENIKKPTVENNVPKPRKTREEIKTEQKALLDRIKVKEDIKKNNAVKEIPEQEAKKNIKEVKEKHETPTLEKKVNKLMCLNEYNFAPRYNKVLFVRALPISTIFPIHLAALSKASFVDFNKESCYDGFTNVFKTTIKESKLPEAEVIVADAVAGNGIEKVAEKFDYVVAIVPEDIFVINTFVKRYPNLADLILIQNSAKLIDFKANKDLFGTKPSLTSFLNEKTLAIQNAIMEKKLLMDDPEYARSVNFIIKALNKEVEK